jgi:hypothetical protein
LPSYIIAIAWLYVTLLMALTERSFVAGVATFVFYGLVPLAILLWLIATPARRRRRRAAQAAAGERPAGERTVAGASAAPVDPDD